jgi:8-oxo-dGTP diphosphatase
VIHTDSSPDSPPAGADPAAASPRPIRFAPLRTERLKLRPLVETDAPDLHRLVTHWEVCRNLAHVPLPYELAHAREWIARTAADLAAGTACHVAIVGTEADGREVFVGVAGLDLDPAARAGRLGYWVGRPYWGHGVATEAVGRLVRWALATLGIDRIRADVATDNPASAAVLRRLGFRPDGTGTEAFLARRGTHPVHRFLATRAEIFAAEPDPPAAPDARASPSGARDAAPKETPERPILLVAACALIDTDGRVLLARRPEGKALAGLWEFPGGKLAAGETPEAALIRELKEELGIDVTAACLAPFAFASHGYERFHLLMPLYLCRRWKGTPTPREGQELAWVRPARLADYPMPPADAPLIPLLRDYL